MATFVWLSWQALHMLLHDVQVSPHIGVICNASRLFYLSCQCLQTRNIQGSGDGSQDFDGRRGCDDGVFGQKIATPSAAVCRWLLETYEFYDILDRGRQHIRTATSLKPPFTQNGPCLFQHPSLAIQNAIPKPSPRMHGAIHIPYTRSRSPRACINTHSLNGKFATV